ncbi:Uncharacterised protein [Mycobacterium tuberculosis]|nr:Uncharacterised protein [Mycobacterium tuberculosis]
MSTGAGPSLRWSGNGAFACGGYRAATPRLGDSVGSPAMKLVVIPSRPRIVTVDDRR